MSDWDQQCERGGHAAPFGSTAWRCTVCGSAMRFEGPRTISRDQIDVRTASLWRYAAILPVAQHDAVSVGEGMTPLVTGKLAGRRVFLKFDGVLPSGSFKDRGATVLVSFLRAKGVGRIVLDSSGNAAAAMACYAAAGGLEASVFVPADVAKGKLIQAQAYGAVVTRVSGGRSAAEQAAMTAVTQDANAVYASHNWHGLFVHGVKTWALEAWEQMEWRLPRYAFIPTSGGSAFVGGFLGFAAASASMPALVAAQPSACAPLATIAPDGTSFPPVVPGPTIADGARIGNPVRPVQILEALRESRGWVEVVTDDEIAAAMRDLWAMGLYVEPTAALGAAAFVKAVHKGLPVEDDEAVILLTGHGLKATVELEELVATPT